jgi:hypothetical protein
MSPTRSVKLNPLATAIPDLDAVLDGRLRSTVSVRFRKGRMPTIDDSTARRDPGAA